VDLRSLQSPDSLYFVLASSDVGEFGINTPLFFAIDDVAVSKDLVATTDIAPNPGFQVYPNPFSSTVNIRWPDQGNQQGIWQLLDSAGKVLWEDKSAAQASIEHFNKFPNGVYWLRWSDGVESNVQKIIKVAQE
jgi:hypothetical protein